MLVGITIYLCSFFFFMRLKTFNFSLILLALLHIPASHLGGKYKKCVRILRELVRERERASGEEIKEEIG